MVNKGVLNVLIKSYNETISKKTKGEILEFLEKYPEKELDYEKFRYAWNLAVKASEEMKAKIIGFSEEFDKIFEEYSDIFPDFNLSKNTVRNEEFHIKIKTLYSRLRIDEEVQNMISELWAKDYRR